MYQGERTSVTNGFPISWEWFSNLLQTIFRSAVERFFILSANDFPPWAVRRVRCCGECAGSPCLQYEKCRNRFASFRLLLFQVTYGELFLFGSLHLVFTVSFFLLRKGLMYNVLWWKNMKRPSPLAYSTVSFCFIRWFVLPLHIACCGMPKR